MPSRLKTLAVAASAAALAAILSTVGSAQEQPPPLQTPAPGTVVPFEASPAIEAPETAPIEPGQPPAVAPGSGASEDGAAAPPVGGAAGAPTAPTDGPGAGEAIATPEVQEDAPPQPTPQGTRAPVAATNENTGGTLYPLLVEVRRAPPAIDGTPQPRPNDFASEPTTEMQPLIPSGSENLFPEGYVE